MSLLTETSATVLEYQSLSNSLMSVSEFISNPLGLTSVKIVATCTPKEINTLYPLLDIHTGEPVNLKERGLLVNNVLMESGADGPLVVTPALTVSFRLVGALPDLSDHCPFDNTEPSEADINSKFYGEVSDNSTAGNYVIEYYPFAAIYTQDNSSNGNIVSGSIVVTLNCIKI